MTQSFVAGRRYFDDKNFPRGFARSGKFTLKEAQMLEQHGVAYLGLDNGTTAPRNDEEVAFVAMCRGEREAVSSHEKLWAKYKMQVSNTRSFHTIFGRKRIADDSDMEIDMSSDD